MQLPDLLPQYGIDSYARATVFSALVLRHAYYDSDDRNLNDSVQIAIATPNPTTANLVIRCAVQYDNFALLNNGDVLSNIEERVTGSVLWTGTATPSTEPDVINPPVTVQTVEQFFYWSAQQFLLKDLRRVRSVNIVPIFKGRTTIIDCIVTIPINYSVFLATNNMLQSIDIVTVEEGEAGGGGDSSGGFNNNTALNNETQLTN